MIPVELIPSPARVAYACGVMDAEVGDHWVNGGRNGLRYDYEDLAVTVLRFFGARQDVKPTSEQITLLAEAYEDGWHAAERMLIG